MAARNPYERKIVINDVNIWISYLIGSQYGVIIDILKDPHYKFLICPEYVSELKGVIARPKFRKWFTKEAGDELLNFVQDNCIMIPIHNETVQDLRDPNDAYLINLALQGGADILVSNDKDIIEMKGRIGRTSVMTFSEFIGFYISDVKSRSHGWNPGNPEL